MNSRFTRGVAIGGLIVACCMRVVAGDPTTDLTAMKSALEKWVETKQLISREIQKSQEQVAVLKDRISLTTQQVNTVRGKIKDTNEAIAEADNKQKPLDVEGELVEKSLDMLQQRIGDLEGRTLTLLRAAPEPAQEKARALSQQIPTSSEPTKLSLTVRYQNLIGILNILNKFNNEITLATDVHDLGNGESMEVRVLYFGLGQAYFCNKEGLVGGVGGPGPDGWAWKRQDEIAPTVDLAIAQYLNEKEAAFQALPVTIMNLEDHTQ